VLTAIKVSDEHVAGARASQATAVLDLD